MPLEDLADLSPFRPNLVLDGELGGKVSIYTGFNQTEDGRLKQVADRSRRACPESLERAGTASVGLGTEGGR